MEKMEQSISPKVPKLMRYLEKCSKPDTVSKACANIAKAVEKKEDDTPQIMGTLVALSAYFTENSLVIPNKVNFLFNTRSIMK